MIAEFHKRDRARWISHLDLQRAMQRALRRAKLPVGYSQGFNPHVNLSFASALSLGLESLCEILDVELSAPAEPEAFMAALNAVLPAGLKILRARLVEDAAPAPMALMRFAEYQAFVLQSGLTGAASTLMASETVLAQKQSKKGTRQVDIRPMLFALEALEEAAGTRLTMLLLCSNADNLRPEAVLSALGARDASKTTRTRLLKADGSDLFLF
ncbi:MAG: TIGR03936 family radical SAM-associated protein [Christensenellaceae bacterium]|jgi:radical SAM-linked protein|nr:TIGR03936 family radical SAM-associated protein [Christensenellaceae bacterium]